MGRTKRRLRRQQEPEPGILVKEDDLILAQHAAALACTFLQDPEYVTIKVLGHRTIESDPPEKLARIEMSGSYHNYQPFGLQYFHVAQQALRLYASSAENDYKPTHRADKD